MDIHERGAPQKLAGRIKVVLARVMVTTLSAICFPELTSKGLPLYALIRPSIISYDPTALSEQVFAPPSRTPSSPSSTAAPLP